MDTRDSVVSTLAANAAAAGATNPDGSPVTSDQLLQALRARNAAAAGTTDASTDQPGADAQAQSGGAVRPRATDYAGQEVWAGLAYDQIRADPGAVDRMAAALADAPRADGSTGFSAAELAAVHQHLFLDQHPLDGPEGDGTSMRRYDADADIAEAWFRMQQPGAHLPQDRTLLEHELAELQHYEQNPGAPYREAHAAANEVADWESDIPAPRPETRQRIPDGGSRGDLPGVHEDSRDRDGGGVPLRRGGGPDRAPGDDPQGGPVADGAPGGDQPGTDGEGDRSGGGGRQSGGRLAAAGPDPELTPPPGDGPPSDGTPTDQSPSDGPSGPLPPRNLDDDGQVLLANGVQVTPSWSRAQLDLPPSFDADLAAHLPPGVTPEAYDALRTTPLADLDADQRTVLRTVRDAVVLADGDLAQRALTGEHLRNYLSNTPVVVGDVVLFDPAGTKGFTTRASDVQDLTTPAQVIDGLALLYDDPGYVERNGRPPYTPQDSFTPVLRFPVESASALHTPYSTELGGQDNWDPPFTGNGLTSSPDVRVPEFLADDFSPLPDGAEIYGVDPQGRETLLAVFEDGVWFPTVEGAQAQQTSTAATTTEDTDARDPAPGGTDPSRRPLRGLAGSDLGGRDDGPPPGLGEGVRRRPGGPGVHDDADRPVGPGAAQDPGAAVPPGDVLPVEGSTVPGGGTDPVGGPPAGVPGPGRDGGTDPGADEGRAGGLRGDGSTDGGDRPPAGADRADGLIPHALPVEDAPTTGMDPVQRPPSSPDAVADHLPPGTTVERQVTAQERGEAGGATRDDAGRVLRGVAGTDVPGVGDQRAGDVRGVRRDPGGPGVHPGPGEGLAPAGAGQRGPGVRADVPVPVAGGDVLGGVAQRPAGTTPAGLGRGRDAGPGPGVDQDGRDGLGGGRPGVGGDRPGAGAQQLLSDGDVPPSELSSSGSEEMMSSAQALDGGARVPISLDSVAEVAAVLGIDLGRAEVLIGTSPDDVAYYDGQQSFGSTNLGADGRPQIVLAPAAFADRETLVRTLAHEDVHVDQFLDGRVVDSATGDLEAEARGVEDGAWQTYEEGGHGRAVPGAEDVRADRVGPGGAGLAGGGGDPLHRVDPAGRGDGPAGARPVPGDPLADDGGRRAAGAPAAPGGRGSGDRGLDVGGPPAELTRDDSPLESGGAVRPRDVLDPDVQGEWAQRVYDALVGDPAAAATMAVNLVDAPRADGSTGFGAEDVRRALQHVVVDEHLLTDPDTGRPTRRARFDPDPDVAEAFTRVVRGTHTAVDVALVEHQVAESGHRAGNPEATHREAHEAANRVVDGQWLPGEPTRADETIEGLEGTDGGVPGVPQGERDPGDGRVPVGRRPGGPVETGGARSEGADAVADGGRGGTAHADAGPGRAEAAARDGDLAGPGGRGALDGDAVPGERVGGTETLDGGPSGTDPRRAAGDRPGQRSPDRSSTAPSEGEHRAGSDRTSGGRDVPDLAGEDLRGLGPAPRDGGAAVDRPGGRLRVPQAGPGVREGGPELGGRGLDPADLGDLAGPPAAGPGQDGGGRRAGLSGDGSGRGGVAGSSDGGPGGRQPDRPGLPGDRPPAGADPADGLSPRPGPGPAATGQVFRPGDVETGVPRSVVEPGRYLSPGDDVAAALARVVPTDPLADLAVWVPAVNPVLRALDPRSAQAQPWANNCGECSRAVADIAQGIDVRPALGDGALRPGESQEMWSWTGSQPTQTLTAAPDADHVQFTADAWTALETDLVGRPVGTVAVVGVDWHDADLGPDGGHWFNAVVIEDGVQWVDGQTGETSGWPPGYQRQVWQIEAAVREPGGTWTGAALERARDTGTDTPGDTAGGTGDGAAVAGGRPDGAGPEQLGRPAVPGRVVDGAGAPPAGRLGLPGAPGDGPAGPVQRPRHGGGGLPGDGGRPGLTAGRVVSPEQAERLADLRRRMVEGTGPTRLRARGPATELLTELGLVQGAADTATGQVVGGSPDVELRLAALPADVEADARTLNELLGTSAVPEAVAGRLATTVRVLVGGGLPAVLAQVPGVLVGALSGDWARLGTAVASAAVGVAASTALGLADRAHARLSARMAVHDDARRGPSPAVRGVLDAATARLAGEVEAFRTELASAGVDRSDRARPGRVLPPATTPAAPAPTGSGDVVATTPSGPPDVRPSVPRFGAWLARSLTGPATALVGVGVLALVALPLSPALAWGALASTAAAGLVAHAQRSFADRKAELEQTRKAVEQARGAATAQARAAAELQVEVEAREATERLLAAVRGPLTGPPVTGDPPADGTAGQAPSGPVLAPGGVRGPLDAASLGSADRARLADVATAAQAVLDAGRDDPDPALQTRLRAAAEAAGMLSDPTGTGSDPDALGWPHRRLLLDPTLQPVVAQLDTLPTAVPRLRSHLASAAWGAAVPGALTALPGVLLGVGVGPLALVALGVLPVGAAVATAVRQHAAASTVERATTARARAKTDLPAAARVLLDAEVADARAVARARRQDLAAAEDVAAGVDRVREARAERQVARRRLLDALVGPADPSVELPVVPDPTPVRPTVPAAPGPVTPDAAVTAPWVRSVATAVAAPVLGTVASVVAWHASFAADAGALWDPGTWTTLAGLPQVGAVAVVAALGAAVSAGVSTSLESWAENSRAATREQRAAALKVHEAARAVALREVELGRPRAARDGLLDAVRRAEAASTARAVQAEQQAEDAVPRRPAGLVVRLVEWMQTQTEAVARAVLDGARPGEPAGRAALSRLATGLSVAPRAEAPERISRLLHAARADGLGPGDVPGSPELDRVLELDAALPGGPATGAGTANAGIDWARMARIANATGWWPEEEDEVVVRVVRELLPAAPDRAPAAGPTRPSRGPAGAAPPPFPYGPPPTAPAPGAAPAHAPAHAPSPGGSDERVLVDDRRDGTGRTTATVVHVTSPTGQSLPVLARWIEPGPGRRPVLVLSEVPGAAFWWGVPAAVQQAVTGALDRLLPDGAADRLRGLVLLAERPGPGGRPDLAEYPVTVTPDGTVQPAGGPRVLPAGETAAATAALRLTPVAQLLGRLTPEPVEG
ncbi:hypothetical protein F1C76_06790 [Geodermatophilaceae bacterium NBWT11]|nr:hypothetical protein F1C76_06790 [Geodermatophilaceae bacterium NBWT11]